MKILPKADFGIRGIFLSPGNNQEMNIDKMPILPSKNIETHAILAAMVDTAGQSDLWPIF